MKNTVITASFFLLAGFSCTVLDKKAEQREDDSAYTQKNRVYKSVQKIAEAFPLTQDQAFSFFTDLDSLQSKKFRNSPGQQFKYEGYTVFYAHPGSSKKMIKGVGIDVDSTSHIKMEQLAQQLGITWHNMDLIDMKAGQIHYSSVYTDAKKEKKEIHVTLNLSEKNKEVSFISIDKLEDAMVRN